MKRKIYITAILLVMALGIGVFWACQKDTEQSDILQNKKLIETKKHKSIGDHQQPTQNISINPTVNIGNMVYAIVGSAEVGNYDGRIYECEATWTIHIGALGQDFTLHFTAALHPEYEDLMQVIVPSMENYIVMVNGITVDDGFVLIENGVEIINYTAISELWTSIVAECNQNTTINEYGAEALVLSRETEVNIILLANMQIMDEFENIFDPNLFVFDGIDTLQFIENLMPLANYMQNTQMQVSSLYPSFDNLSDETKALVLAEVGYISLVQENGGEPPCMGPLERKRDKEILIACAQLGVSVAGLVAAAATGYGALTSIVGIILSSREFCLKWHEEWRKYQENGGTEPKPRLTICD
ncbi:MAG TPA: hypothetical protein PLF32_00005 [Bacteroidales bacterium]|nr:hypothetical protein [Bacteroidales bacterium]HOR81025.1 hypothetical protein [Bacteroidales bacterium]HPJ91080.1 hypothetical protein [Bacteroidales bacterium]